MNCKEPCFREKEKATFSVAWCGLWETTKRCCKALYFSVCSLKKTY